MENGDLWALLLELPGGEPWARLGPAQGELWPGVPHRGDRQAWSRRCAFSSPEYEAGAPPWWWCLSLFLSAMHRRARNACRRLTVAHDPLLARRSHVLRELLLCSAACSAAISAAFSAALSAAFSAACDEAFGSQALCPREPGPPAGGGSSWPGGNGPSGGVCSFSSVFPLGS